jgi:hypothetical protein
MKPPTRTHSLVSANLSRRALKAVIAAHRGRTTLWAFLRKLKKKNGLQTFTSISTNWHSDCSSPGIGYPSLLKSDDRPQLPEGTVVTRTR